MTNHSLHTTQKKYSPIKLSHPKIKLNDSRKCPKQVTHKVSQTCHETQLAVQSPLLLKGLFTGVWKENKKTLRPRHIFLTCQRVDYFSWIYLYLGGFSKQIVIIQLLYQREVPSKWPPYYQQSGKKFYVTFSIGQVNGV